MKNVILYCRVSSDEQKTNTSLEFQEKKLRRYCEDYGYNVIACYHEDYSAKHHNFKRPEMIKIKEYCSKNKQNVDLILFLRWDRFSRNPEFAYMFKRLFMDEWGIEFNAIEGRIDFESTEWSTALANACSIAHTENNKISRRTRDGVRETLLSGRLANKAPRGYKNVHITDEKGITVSKTVEIDEEKAPAIRALFYEIAKGIEAPCAVRRRIAPEIPESTFLDLLRNVVYKGKVRVPATKTEPEEIVEGLHEALVPEEIFDKVQDILNGKTKKNPKLTKSVNPELYLRKFLVCPCCGKAISGGTSTGGSGGKYSYYHCQDKKHIHIKAGEVNTAFINYISTLRPNEAVLQIYEEVLTDLRNDKVKDVKRMIASINDDIRVQEERIDKIEDKYLDGELDRESYKHMMDRHKKKIKILESKKELLETPNRGKVEPQLKYSINLIDNIDKFFKYAPADAKIRALSSIFPEKIKFDGKNFRTDSLNSVLGLIYQQTNELRGLEKENEESFSTFPASVPRPGIEPGWK